ncbi:MAG: response regulator [Armatimonadetes bacterium]|nr:response regulator [Armatimonadota bacterium]
MDERFLPLPNKPIAQGEHILVVDDTPAMANLIAGYLREAGYKVEIAYSAEEAWEALLQKLPILITVDDFLPGASGYELCRSVLWLYNDKWYGCCRIMIVDQRLDHNWSMGYRSPLFDICLTKPFNPKELVSFVRRIMQASSEGDGWYQI